MRRGPGWRLCTALVLAAVAARGRVGAAPATLPAALLDPTSDRVVARTVVPDEVRKVGEVRLVSRGNATVVQTLLSTKVLGRVVAEIRKKEEGNWPPDAAGHADMRRYVEGLAAAAAELRTRGGEGGERRLRLLIEFVASETAAGVVFAEFEGDEKDGRIEPRSRRPIAVLVLGRAYVFPNMRFILADSFHVPVPEVGRLGPLGPLGGPTEAPPR